jgi:SAM-dependent methyltransferase
MSWGMNPAEFDNIARTEETLWWYRGMERILHRFLAPLIRGRAIDEVLEAGCGTGHMSKVLADRYRWRMTPMDLSDVGLAHAARRGLTRLVQADMRRLPFRDTAFDALFSLDVIAHLEPAETPAAFVEFARVIRPGGLLILRASALQSLRSRHSMFVNERQRLTARRVREACRHAGLRVLRLTYLNSLLLPVAFAKFRLWEPLTNAAPSSGVAPVAPWLNRLLEQPLRLEEAMVASGVNLPIGQSLLLAAERPT